VRGAGNLQSIAIAVVVMAGLDLAIQAATLGEESRRESASAERSTDGLDGRVEPGHDGGSAQMQSA
jgi:hypothetical protein